MVKKNTVTLLLLISILIVLSACQKATEIPSFSPQKYNTVQDYNKAKLASFVQTKLRGEHGIHTNYLDNEQAAEVATGHEVLSESSGLLLRYYAIEQNKKEFDTLWKQTQSTFNIDSGFSYRYSPLHEKTYMMNNAIDDLRIIKSLFEAYDAFGDQSYKEQAYKYGERFAQYNINENQMYNMYDYNYNSANELISLSYIDHKTLSLLSEHLHLNALIDNLLKVTKNGYISDEFPFYQTRYIYEKDEYVSENINTIESLITILHLVEVGEHNPNSISFIKEKINSNQLFGQYATDGTALNEVQSPAIYALVAMIGSTVGDQELYGNSIALMEQTIVLDDKHELFGAHANTESMQLYSFDNLQALLAYTY